MSLIIKDLQQLYQRTFGTKPHIGEEKGSPLPAPFTIDGTNPNARYSESGQPLYGEYLGKEIWLPVTFTDLDRNVFAFDSVMLPYVTVKISVKKTIIKTPLANRKGTVKEQYSVEDYGITLKGFAIDEDRVWPEKQLTVLKYLFESKQGVGLECPLTDIFLINRTVGADPAEMQRVVCEGLELPIVEGGRNHVRPFSMQLESDSVFTLEI